MSINEASAKYDACMGNCLQKNILGMECCKNKLTSINALQTNSHVILGLTSHETIEV